MTFIAAASLLAIPSLTKAADETFNNLRAIAIPNLTSFDISWFDLNASGFMLVFDGTGAGAVDQIITLPKFGSVSPHSIAAINDFVFVPNAGEVDLYQPEIPDSDDPSSPNLSN